MVGPWPVAESPPLGTIGSRSDAPGLVEAVLGVAGPARASAQRSSRRRRRRGGGVTAAYRRMRARWHARAPERALEAFAAASPKPLVLVPIARGRRFVLYPIGGRPEERDEAEAAAVAPEEGALSEEELDALDGGDQDNDDDNDAEDEDDNDGSGDDDGSGEDSDSGEDEAGAGADAPAQDADDGHPDEPGLAAGSSSRLPAPGAEASSDAPERPWDRVERLLDQEEPWTPEEAEFVEALMVAVDGHVGGPIPPWDEVTPGVSRFDDPDELALAREALAYRKNGAAAPIHPRLLELVYRAVLHFEVPYVHVISGYRPTRSTSRHAQGRAIDLVLPGVRDSDLARFLRKQGFVGVGLYPKSGFVHLDVRAQSYFWLDPSAPGRRQRPRRILAEYGQRMDAEARARGETAFGTGGPEEDGPDVAD